MQSGDWQVRGTTRNPSSEAAQALAATGVEIVKADFDDVQSLVEAFSGATVIYSNTDYFVHLFVAIGNPEIAGGRTPNQYAHDREVEQGINISQTAASPSVLKTLSRFILSDLPDPRKWGNGKYTKILHNESKARIVDATRTQYPELAAKMSTVQIGHYVNNWKTAPALQPKREADGSYTFKRTFSAEYRMPFVVPHKDTGAFVRALVDLPTGTNLLGVSELLTWPEWSKIWGEVLGVEARFKQVSNEEFFQGMPIAFASEFEESFAFIEELGYTGGDPDVVFAEEVSIVALTHR